MYHVSSNFVLVTGAAGFIGYHLTCSLLKGGIPVVAIDNLNAYYDPTLKERRIEEIEKLAKCVNVQFVLIQGDLEDLVIVQKVFREYSPDYVVNLAAQAGVRYSIENPGAYINSTILGF